jgi:hypothetical protein
MHDLRSPLLSVLNTTATMQEMAPTTSLADAGVKRGFDVLAKCASFMENIVSDMLGASPASPTVHVTGRHPVSPSGGCVRRRSRCASALKQPTLTHSLAVSSPLFCVLCRSLSLAPVPVPPSSSPPTRRRDPTRRYALS